MVEVLLTWSVVLASCTSSSFGSVQWNACVLRLDLGLYYHPKEVFFFFFFFLGRGGGGGGGVGWGWVGWGAVMDSKPMLTPMENHFCLCVCASFCLLVCLSFCLSVCLLLLRSQLPS